MEYIRLKDIDFKTHINGRVFTCFMTNSVSVRLQKDKVTKFITFNMVDKDKVVDVKLFGATQQQIDMIQNGKTYNAAVDVKEYDKGKDGISCIIYNIEPSSLKPEYFADWADNMDKSKKVIENVLGEIVNTMYGQIAYPILIKNWDKFYSWTAAKSQHHGQLGGLLSHTAEVIELCDVMADFFNQLYGEDFINRPLLLSAALLHDIGKVNELDVDIHSGNTEYSTNAALSTHIMDIISEVDRQVFILQLGEQVYEINEINEEEGIKTAEQLEEEREAVRLIKHCVGAHHGKLEWGATVVPAVPEAFILHTMDNMDAEMFRYHKSFKEMKPSSSMSSWGAGGIKSVYKESNK